MIFSNDMLIGNSFPWPLVRLPIFGLNLGSLMDFGKSLKFPGRMPINEQEKIISGSFTRCF